MNVSDTCNAAADLLHGQGWTRGTSGWPFAGSTSPLCLEGALIAAAHIDVEDRTILWACPAYKAVAEYVGHDVTLDALGIPQQPLWKWNDGPARDIDHVIATLRAVAVIHAARENESVETRTVEAVSA